MFDYVTGHLHNCQSFKISHASVQNIIGTFKEVTGSINASKGDTFDTFERDTFCISEGENDLLSCFLHGFTT